ncbi:MAG: periplasmic heavy metal sensor [Deltaproteobacteria bacterium]|nr:periplasmic heavy metal sensor [Deltaproteobacteria bacterium]
MLGFLIGTACLVGLCKVLRHGRSCHGPWGHHGGCGLHGGCGPRGGFGGWRGEHQGPFGGGGAGGGPERWMLRGLFQRLETTPGQEKVILAAAEELRARAGTMRDSLWGARGDVARSFRAPSFDETAVGTAFARADESHEALRRAALDAIAKVYEALDERQRRELADLIDRGFDGWRAQGYGHGPGPYRF